MTNSIIAAPPTFLKKPNPPAYKSEPVPVVAQNKIISSLKSRRMRMALQELARRGMESLSIYASGWMLLQSRLFHQCLSTERIAVGSNRSSKTHSMASELVWLATGTHPWDKYFPKENARIHCVGFDEKHIRDPMWSKIGRPGAFKIIRDEHTGIWRPVFRDFPYDEAYREKWRDASPMLPARMIDDIGWYEKKTDCPRLVKLKNGTEITFHSSKGAPQQGTALDFWWVDEEMENENWVPELQRGCVSTKGRGVYSATPLAASSHLHEMHKRANSIDEDHDVSEFVFLIRDNIFMSEQEKITFQSQLSNEDQVQVRIHGKWLLARLAVYPEFTRENHVCDPFEIPSDWSRYMVVDPGVQVCAVLFIAVPPPPNMADNEEQRKLYTKRHGEVHIYDELYIRRCSSDIFGSETASRMGDLRRGAFTAFLIDGRMGRQKEMGGKTVQNTYMEALRDNGVYSASTGSDFIWGNDDIRAREEALRRWLAPRISIGKPTLLIHSKCRYLIWEFDQQFYLKDKDGKPTDKRKDRNNHAVTAAEYVADYGPQWVVPRKPPKQESLVMQAWKRIQSKNKKKLSSTFFGPQT